MPHANWRSTRGWRHTRDEWRYSGTGARRAADKGAADRVWVVKYTEKDKWLLVSNQQCSKCLGFWDDRMKLHRQLLSLDNINYGLHLGEFCMWQWGCAFSIDVAEPRDVLFERWGCWLYACIGEGRGENFVWHERALFQLHEKPLRNADVEFQPGWLPMVTSWYMVQMCFKRVNCFCVRCGYLEITFKSSEWLQVRVMKLSKP